MGNISGLQIGDKVYFTNDYKEGTVIGFVTDEMKAKLQTDMYATGDYPYAGWAIVKTANFSDGRPVFRAVTGGNFVAKLGNNVELIARGIPLANIEEII